jgi:ribosome biogenesis protein MAK21
VWHEQAVELPELDSSEPLKDDARILRLKEEAKQLYEKLSAEFEEKRSRKERADENWMNTVMKSGTMSDKMAAMILLVQAAPLYRVKTLHALLNQAAKHGRREALFAIDTLKDLFLTNLLPDNRKLVAFHHRPLSATNITEMHKVYWYFEDILKSLYAEFVSILSKASHDTVLHTKKKAQHVAFEMLCDKPEMEQQLLALLVNKLGDPEKKIASNSAHLLNILLKRHRGMKLVVAREVETFLHRSSVSLRAQYYGIIFLNQILLTEDQPELCKKLLTIYFSMFKKLTDVNEDTSSKMLGALLTGVNRAFPFTSTDQDDLTEQLDILFKIVHVASFNKSAQALQLIYQVMYAQQNLNDRFYRALYQKLSSPELAHSSRQGLFLNVLYKALKNDSQLTRVSAFVKRLLQICLFQSPAFVCGSLYLVSEITKGKKELHSKFEKPATISEAIRANSLEVEKRIKAEMASRLDPLASIASAIDGADLNTSKKSGQIVFGGKERITIQAKGKTAANGTNATSSSTTDGAQQSSSTPSGISSAPAYATLVNPIPLNEIRLEAYDANARDPLYAHADTTVWWELVNLSKHFHPSVSKWAQCILEKTPIQYSGDPLVDFGLQAFLDRIVYKNPKQIQAGNSKNAHAKKSLIPSDRIVPINSQMFIDRPEDTIPEDQLFFYKYFQQRDALHPNDKKKKKKKATDSEEEEFSDVDDFDFDENEGAMDVDDSEGDDGSEGEVDDTEFDDVDSNFSDDLDEHAVEEAVLKGFEKVEGRKLYDRKAMAADQGKTYDYEDLQDEDFEDEEDEDDGEAMDSFLSTIGGADDSDDASDGEPIDNVDFVSEKPSRKKKSPVSTKGTFAGVDEFQHILESSGMEHENKWDKMRDSGPRKNFKKRKAPSGPRQGQRTIKKSKR